MNLDLQSNMIFKLLVVILLITSLSASVTAISLVGNELWIIDDSLNNIAYSIESQKEISVLTIEDTQTITIKQLEQDTIYVYYGKPNKAVLESNKPVIYIVEHYDPDKEIDDVTRELGIKRLDVVVKDAKVEVDNGIIVKTNGLKVNTKSFLQASELNTRQIDYIEKNKVTEIFGDLQKLIIKVFERFSLNGLFDRGFTVTSNAISIEPEINLEHEFFDIVNDVRIPLTSEGSLSCDKFGYSTVPGFGYNFLENLQGTYVIGMAYSKNNDFSYAKEDMINFIETSNSNNLIPVMRIIGNTYQNDSGCNTDYCFGSYAYDEIVDAKIVSDFINEIDIEYVQIWDKPEEKFNAEEYINYIKTIKQNTDVKIINGAVHNNDYFSQLISLGLLDLVDIIALPYGYEIQLKLIPNEKTVILTDTIFNDFDSVEKLRKIKNNIRLSSVNLFLANYWNTDDNNIWQDEDMNWLNNNEELRDVSTNIFEEVCG